MSDIITIQNQIFTFRDVQVMVDKDLAEMYQVETKVLNQAVKRNSSRFPNSFRFQLTDIEKNELVTNCDRFNKLKHSSVNPFVFTEQGIAMLSAVLRSDIAVQVSIQIMNAFVEIRKFINNNTSIFHRLEHLEQKQLIADQQFNKLFKALENNNLPPNQGIFYDGQVFDAYVFVADIIKTATKNIVLIDNYIDENTLLLLAKRNSKVNCTIYTQNLNKTLILDIAKHNKQYPNIAIQSFNKAHDRFLIIDDITVFHIGASLKDLGKKWFAFSKMEMKADDLLNQINSKL